jgi:putative ABC transport system ATP-binding protein
MLFGRIGHQHADGPERIRGIVREVLDELHLSNDVLDIGLDYNVGVGGKRLTAAQRQKLHVARALLKHPDVMIFNKPLSALDLRSQEHIIRAILEAQDGWKPTILWVLTSPALAHLFDRVIVLDRGISVEDGKYDELVGKKGVFAGLISA